MVQKAITSSVTISSNRLTPALACAIYTALGFVFRSDSSLEHEKGWRQHVRHHILAGHLLRDHQDLTTGNTHPYQRPPGWRASRFCAWQCLVLYFLGRNDAGAAPGVSRHCAGYA